jgi:hypothetical protein
MTQNEYNKAAEYKSDYILVIVSNLVSTPKLSLFENPIELLQLTPREQRAVQTNFYSEDLIW